MLIFVAFSIIIYIINSKKDPFLQKRVILMTLIRNKVMRNLQAVDKYFREKYAFRLQSVIFCQNNI